MISFEKTRLQLEAPGARYVLYLACLALVTLLLIWRRPDAFTNPQFWAEDGTYFFTQAHAEGVRSLVTPMAGYYHIVSRLVALSGLFFPVSFSPGWYVFATWALLAVQIAYLFSKRIPFNNSIKFAAGLALVATSIDNEVFFNIANWATLMAVCWLLIAISSEQKGRLQLAFDLGFLILSGLNTPFAICLWLLFLLRWWINRTPNNLYLLVASVCVGAIQFWNMPGRLGGETLIGNTPLFRPLADVIVYRFGMIFLGDSVLDWLGDVPRRWIIAVLIICFYIGFVYYAVHHKNWTQFTLLAAIVLVAGLSLFVLRNSLVYAINSHGRHFYLPYLTLAWAFLFTKPPRHQWKWVPIAAMFAAFLFLTPGYKWEIRPDLKWATQVAQCENSTGTCAIPINPVWNPPVWFAYLPSEHVKPAGP